MSRLSYYKTVVKSIVLLSPVLFQFTNVKAQNRYGVMGGVGKSSLYNFPVITGANNSYSSITSFWGGITADFPISRHGISLFTSALYNKKGYSYSSQKQTGANNTVKDSGSSQNLKYLDIHLMVLKKFSWNKKSSFFIGTGPSANIFTSGIEQTSLTYFGNTTGSVVRTQNKLIVGNAPGAYKGAFFSWGFALGFELDNIKLWIDYNLPLTYYYQDATQSIQYKSKSFGINLGYTLFKGKQKERDKKEKKAKDEEKEEKKKEEKEKKEKDKKDKKDKTEDAIEKAKKDSLDTDGDGIADINDKCPGHKGIAKYGGCPVPDADGDGISDDDDKCPMVAGPLSNSGCPEFSESDMGSTKDTMKWIIYFEPGKSDLRTEGFIVLNQVIQLLKSNKKMVVQFNGHTDNVGSIEANSIRAFSRAMVCVDYVASYFIERKRLTAAAFSNKKPAADLNDPLLQWKNRRVEVFVYEKKDK